MNSSDAVAFFVVHGAIQGVGYRSFVASIAEKYSLSGMARNVYDGSVEVLAIGSRKSIEAFLNRINIQTKHGIAVFNIELHYDKHWIEKRIYPFILGDFKGFTIEKTKLR
ncbi:MAG: acylphosphatase [Candidatus Marsarchaeota archaeon]|nr:acylphosphatase [Candidatus Marsarchaeota archaeon]MCL5105838.1 acylphosphatase [Candidatus Marsarchaeota archaeon]